MKSNRRDLLSVLGLGGAAAVAISTDAAGKSFEMGGTSCPAIAEGGKEAQENIASQLEAMAAAIRAGTVTVCEMGTRSNMNMRDPHFLEHVVELRVEINQSGVA
jgi:hypothetical protein